MRHWLKVASHPIVVVLSSSVLACHVIVVLASPFAMRETVPRSAPVIANTHNIYIYIKTLEQPTLTCFLVYCCSFIAERS
jgi:hypothetical protein